MKQNEIKIEELTSLSLDTSIHKILAPVGRIWEKEREREREGVI